MSEPFIGQIMIFAGNFAPRGWALCNGDLLPIAQNTALFSILGTTYGGNGQTTFGLPDLRGRIPMHPGNGPGLTPRTLGESSGTEHVTLLANEMPAHSHTLAAAGGQGDTSSPEGALNAVLVDPNTQQPLNLYSASATTTMAPTAIHPAGGSQPHTNVQPFQCVNFIIALQGIYPSHN